MLPKENRLTRKKDFETVFNVGKGIKGDFLIGKVAKNHLENSRFGFVVSKKISTKATIRNKVKRRLRQAVVAELGTRKMKAPTDVVVIALPAIKEKSFLEIKEAVTKLLKYV